MKIKYFSLSGMVGYLGFFLMGSFVSELIRWLLTSGTLQPESLGVLTAAVVGVNASLYGLLFLFYLGYFLCVKEQKLLKYICLAGAAVSLLCIVNVLFLSGDYTLSLDFKIMVDIMSMAVNLGFMGIMISLHPEQKPLIILAILAMIPFSTYPLFAAIVLFLLYREQKAGSGIVL